MTHGIHSATDPQAPPAPGNTATSEVSLLSLQRQVEAFVAERNWQRFHNPKNLVIALGVEVAELQEHFQWLTPDEAEAIAKTEGPKGAVAEEMVDVLAYLLALASALQIDLATAFPAKMQKNALKYPAPQ